MRSQIIVAGLSALAAASPTPSSDYWEPSYKPDPAAVIKPVNSTTCNGKNYTYDALAGYGFVPYNARDSKGDTLGGIGSSSAIDPKSWKKVGKNKYEGVFYGLPDRGFNVQGTINYQPRVHKFKVTLDAGKSSGTAADTNLKVDYLESILFKDPSGAYFSGLNADSKAGVVKKFPGFPDLPVVHYKGDGFGGNGTGGEAIVLDAEGFVLNDDGSFWVSDEYGPYIYKFDRKGALVDAIRPPDAFIPQRNGTQSFAGDPAPIYDSKDVPKPTNPTSGRQNNQGLEGLTASPDGKTLYALLQSATRQDGGDGGSSARFYTRFLAYDVSKKPAALKGEYVVRLPQAPDGKTAAQSEIKYISESQFLVLARDSNNGAGYNSTESKYRQADVFDISKATNILGKYDGVNGTIVTNTTTAALRSEITPAQYCKFLNFNNNDQLKRFGLHNGGVDDAGLLNEKWEGFALVPVIDDHGKTVADEYFLFAASDNDLRAKDVYANFGKTLFHDTVNLNNQILVFKVTLPKGSKPRLG